MTALGGSKLITVEPEELKFEFELEKPVYCDIRVSNTTDKNVAFKVKTTSPKKYFVRPNTGVIQPWDACVIRVTLQAQHEYPPDMQSKDKFLLQTTAVAPHTDVDGLPQNTFNKEPGKTVEECKLRVVYVARTAQRSSDDSLNQSVDASSNQAIQDAKASRDAARREADKLQLELDMLKRKGSKSGPGFSIRLAIIAGLVGIMVGFLLKFVLAAPPMPTPGPAPVSTPTPGPVPPPAPASTPIPGPVPAPASTPTAG